LLSLLLLLLRAWCPCHPIRSVSPPTAKTGEGLTSYSALSGWSADVRMSVLLGVSRLRKDEKGAPNAPRKSYRDTGWIGVISWATQNSTREAVKKNGWRLLGVACRPPPFCLVTSSRKVSDGTQIGVRRTIVKRSRDSKNKNLSCWLEACLGFPRSRQAILPALEGTRLAGSVRIPAPGKLLV